MNERRFLEREGRSTFLVTVLFTLAILTAVGLRMLELPVAWYAASISILSVSFTLWIVRRSSYLNRKVQEIRASASPDDPPNPSTVRKLAARFAWEGKSYTSSWRVLGIPCVDIQFQNASHQFQHKPRQDSPGAQPSRAFGWIALGDHATGILFAGGGIARGLIAVGGIATGGIAFGGLSLGVISIGGCAGGIMALGGAAAGWDSAGGVALGYHSAAGGAAAAKHVAAGGFAVAYEHASGGIAWAPNANTESAAAIARSESWLCILLWITEHQVEFTLITIVVALSPLFIAAACQRFSSRQK